MSEIQTQFLDMVVFRRPAFKERLIPLTPVLKQGMSTIKFEPENLIVKFVNLFYKFINSASSTFVFVSSFFKSVSLFSLTQRTRRARICKLLYQNTS